VNRPISLHGSSRHAAILSSDEARAFLAAPGFPLPDATAMRRVGSADAREFLATGLLLRAALEEAAGLDPGHAVLDIGCGWGRLALPLAARLGPRGRYLGMDAAAEAIAWCRRHIQEADPRLGFHHADIRNGYANPQGRIRAEAARLLPWEEHFDRVVAFSLFTHLLPAATARYLAEAARLCRPGGVLVASFFLLDGPARAAIEAGRADRRFPAARGIARIEDPAVPEDAVAYDADQVMAMLDAAGFEAGWRPGSWCDRGVPAFDYQDVVVARRRGSAPAGGGTRGAVLGIADGALTGWAWDAGAGARPAIRLEVAGAVVAEAGPGGSEAPREAVPAGAAAGFVVPLPPHLLGRRLRDVRLLAGAQDLPLLARPALRFADPAEELAQGWRREALRDGLWWIEALERRADGGWAGRLRAVPPRGIAAGRPWLFGGGARVPLEGTGEASPGLARALGLVPGSLRTGHAFVLPGGLLRPGDALALGEAPDRPWAPGAVPLPEEPGEGPPGAALDAAAAAALLRAVTGKRLPADGLDLPPDGAMAVLTAAAPARFASAIRGLDVPEPGGEAALVAALAAALAPGGLLLLGVAGAATLLEGAGGTARLLAWLRDDTAEAPEAPPGRRRLRGPGHLAATWGGAFELLARREAVLQGRGDLVLLRRHR